MRTDRAGRRLAALFVSTVLVGGATLTMAAPAYAVQGPPVLIACPDNGTTYPLTVDQSSCMTLTAALSEAAVDGNDTTVEVMPGDYCPVKMPYAIADITVVGAGQAAIDMTGNPTITGPEAALSTIQWTAACPGAEPSSTLDLSEGRDDIDGNGDPSFLRIENLAVVGSASGPATGIVTGGAGVFQLRDVLVEHQTAVGVDYEANDALNGLIDIADSAVLDNGTGVVIDNAQSQAGLSTIEESTIAENGTGSVGAGIVDTSGLLHLQNDTVANNAGAGVDVSSSVSNVTSQNSIVGGNNPDCGASVTIFGHWEPGGSGAANGTNLTGASCLAANVSSDVSFTGSLSSPSELGGPTPAVPAPTQAIGNGDVSACNSTGTDQREAIYTAGQPCDIGAVDTTTADLTSDPAASPSTLGFGTVKQGIDDIETVTFSNQGGDVVGISSIGITGTDFSISADQCSYRTLVADPTNSTCVVDVEFAPTGSAPYTGSLTLGTATGAIPTVTGSVVVSLTGAGGATAALPGPPTKLHGTVSNARVDLTWQDAAFSASAATITGYQSQLATSAAGPWTTFDNSSNPNEASSTAMGLTNGTGYYFRVGAVTSVGTSWSSTVGPVVPHQLADSSAWSVPVSRTITYGRTASIAATLTDTTTSTTLGSAAVTLLSRPGSSGTFSAVGPSTTSGSGVAAARVKPTQTTQYEWQYAGTSANAGVTSAIATIKVAQAVTVKLVKATIKPGATAKVFGTVSPAATGKTVRLQELVAGKWKTVGAAATLRKQKLPNNVTEVGYVLSLKPAKKATLELRVLRAATATCAAGHSATVKLAVS